MVDKRGEPDEATPSMLVWHAAEPWKRIIATRDFYPHAVPAPHIDSVESFVDYPVPVKMFTPLAEFDGSVIAERTAGEMSARCHDEEANILALNLANDIITGDRTVSEAREYYATEFLNARSGGATPYMERLHFEPRANPDQDVRTLSDDELDEAAREGQA